MKHKLNKRTSLHLRVETASRQRVSPEKVCFQLSGNMLKHFWAHFLQENWKNLVNTLKGEIFSELWSVLGRRTLESVGSHAEMLE